VLPGLLSFISIEWLEKQPTICLYKLVFGSDCYGCGITRAVVSTIQLRFRDAYEFNKMIVIVFPILAIVWWRVIFELPAFLIQQNNTNETTRTEY
jgi:hypothetical protein